jgi:actin beta/gamma 1
MSIDYEAPIVIDNGTAEIRAGFAGDDDPKVKMPTIVGRPRARYVRQAAIAGQATDTYIGHEALSRRGVLEMKYPIENGIVTNWDDVEKVYSYSNYNYNTIALMYTLVLSWCTVTSVRSYHNTIIFNSGP